MLKRIVITLLVVLSLASVVCASNLNRAVTNETTSNTTTQNSIENSMDNSNTLESNNIASEMETNVTSVNNINDVSSSSIGINQILNIFLIAVGLILILLAIAILIRIKK